MGNTVIFEANENFSVPVSIVDKYLDAPETELRLILFLLRNTNRSFLTEDICEKLAVDEKRLKNAFDYWVSKGILFRLRDKYVLDRPRVTASDAIKYSAERISERIEADSKVLFLYKQAETALRRPLTPEISSAILSLVDFVGLPPEVALLLIQYCGDEKKSLHAMVSTGIEWSEKGIDTFEKAENHLKELKERKETENRVSRLLGISGRKLTNDEKTVFVKWSEDFGFSPEVINFAYETSVKNTGKYQYKYMDKVLSAWKEKGYTTVAEIQNDSVPAKKPTKRRRRSENDAAIDATSSEALSWEIIASDLEEDMENGQ